MSNNETLKDYSNNLRNYILPYINHDLQFATPSGGIVHIFFSLENGICINKHKTSINSNQYNKISEYDLFQQKFKPILKPFSDYCEILEITDEMTDYEFNMIEDNPDLV